MPVAIVTVKEKHVGHLRLERHNLDDKQFAKQGAERIYGSSLTYD
jgi:hypothetical protein